jgi:hypothetical protein
MSLSRLLLAAAPMVMIACSGGKGGVVGAGGASGMIYSCTVAGLECLQGTELPSEVAATQTACAAEMGTYAGVPCPATGYAGCCDKPAIQEMECFYPSQNTDLYQGLCASMKGTWVGADGGVSDAGPTDAGVGTGAAAFVGTWSRSGTETLTCPTGTPTTSMIKGDLVITLGATDGTIIGTTADGCMTTFTVSGNVATASPGQTCNTTTDAGVAETITVNSRTLTLSADGNSVDVMGNESVDKTASGVTCTRTGSGTYTKV